MATQDQRRSNKAPKGPQRPLNSCGPGGPTGVIKKGTLKCLAFFGVLSNYLAAELNC